MKAELAREHFAAKSVIIADDMADARAVAAILMRELGMTVYEAEDGLETLSLCKAHQVDLILLDVRMPKLSGQDLISQIRSSSQSYEHVPILAVTGDKSSVVDSAENLLLDISAYLIKPYQPKFLIDVIDGLLSHGIK